MLYNTSRRFSSEGSLFLFHARCGQFTRIVKRNDLHLHKETMFDTILENRKPDPRKSFLVQRIISYLTSAAFLVGPHFKVDREDHFYRPDFLHIITCVSVGYKVSNFVKKLGVTDV